MILGFKKQFKRPILAGTKIHTIREDKTDRWNIGRMIQFATGVRTKKYEQFYEEQCRGIQEIRIAWMEWDTDNVAYIWIDEVCVGSYFRGRSTGRCKEIAENDGFENVDDFFKWFNRDFEGKIIHWTDFKY